MNTVYAVAKDHDNIVAWLDRMKENVLGVIDRGGMVTLHSRTEMKEFEFGHLGNRDFLFTGWTFGVSAGEYPKRASAG